MEAEAGMNWAWIMKKILKQKSFVEAMQPQWTQMLTNRIFSMKQIYKILIDDQSRVPLRRVLNHNMAIPKTKITLRLLCHGNLPTKERLKRFGMLLDSSCSMCGMAKEIVDQLFFTCTITCDMWKAILNWLVIIQESKIGKGK